MQHQPIDKTLAPIKPLLDTWGWKQETGSWCIAPCLDLSCFSTQEFNAWFATTIVKTLDAFSELARAWRVFFGTIYRDDVEGVKLEWELGDSHENYIETVLKAIRDYPAPIFELALEVDLFVFVRTQESPKLPIRAWVRLPRNEIFIVGAAGGREPYLCFETGYTLFRSLSRDYEDNTQLYSLNQPLLENALRRWEEHFGSICEVDGIEGIYEYGFLPEEQWNAESID